MLTWKVEKYFYSSSFRIWACINISVREPCVNIDLLCQRTPGEEVKPVKELSLSILHEKHNTWWVSCSANKVDEDNNPTWDLLLWFLYFGLGTTGTWKNIFRWNRIVFYPLSTFKTFHALHTKLILTIPSCLSSSLVYCRIVR